MSTFDRLGAALADRYRLVRELGAGGMATVYLARDLKHDRDVAIKVLRDELTVMLGTERFLAEIKTTANLQHPHILPLFDSGQVVLPSIIADRSSTIDSPRMTMLYYVMPFVDGETLRDKITRERQCDLTESISIVQQVASALAYAHERGVVHRDIKPENILLSSGHAVVADFGIARAIGAAGGEQLTSAGIAIGTPAYMSPEQSAGVSDVDGRSDSYALASVLFEMLGGEPPHTGATAAAIIAKRLGTTAPSVRILRNTVPAAVDRALQRALQRTPADRFPSATAFAAALEAPRRTAAWQRLTVGVIAVVAMAALGWWLTHRSREAVGLDPDVIAVLPFRVGGNDTKVAYLRESMLDLLQARLSSGDGARTLEPRTTLAAWRRAVANDNEDLSEDASRALARQLGAGRMILGSAITTPSELTLSATLVRVDDGRQLARESVKGAPDSVAALVDRLTAALLIRGAGEATERGAGLAAVPLDALLDYLAGRKAYRRGDYFQAMTLYQRALDRDTTFVEAAYSMAATNAWIGTVFETAGIRVIPRLWAMRDRLGPRDRALLLAIPFVGPNYPNPSTYREIIDQAERAVDLAPDNAESWLLLGQLLSGYGMAASRPDWRPRLTEALQRAVALDSTFNIAVATGLSAAMQLHDSAGAGRYTTLLEARVAAGFRGDVLLLLAARIRGDSIEAMRRRSGPADLTRTERLQRAVIITLHSAQFSLPLADARWAVAQMQHEAATDPERAGALLSELAVRFAAGETVDPQRAGIRAYGAGWAATLIQQGLIDAGYRDLAVVTIAADARGEYLTETPTGRRRLPGNQDCFAELHRVASGDTSGTTQAIARLRGATVPTRTAPTDPGVSQADHRVCPLLLGSLLEAARSTPGAPRPQLDSLDRVMEDGPLAFVGVSSVPTALANYTIARLREAQGDYPSALAAIRRRVTDYFPQYLWSRPAFLRQEGRLAALVGDTIGARDAYDQYLVLRANPDPPFRAQRDSVVAERAALGGRPIR